ncbi:CoA transferase [uncultured Croceicoccus sp.]|uniref:CaiB/BaiF CoA transferase family protein n=1 Tax=uncultured Croceicoccus sp. TaxID=1295329 RepID=UPI002618AB12|nr:CoA transferase [uncultured Croceicoccus sp.]
MLDLLKGIKILDFTTVVLGPYATQILGDLGAEVIKVEPVAGDGFRAVRPGHHPAMGAGYLNLNRNKRSLAIDVKNEAGLEIVDRLVGKADVVVHNMRAASADRLGIGFDRLRTVNPGIACCYTAGFGVEGRDRGEPAYDDIIQARSGLAALNSNSAGEPRFVSTIIADKVGGLHLAIAALAAIVRQQRTGEPVEVEAPMFESLVSFMMVEQLAGKTFDPPLGGMGYERLLSPYRKPYRTKDGFVALLPYNTRQWVRFMQIIGRDDMADASILTDPVERSRNIDTLYAIMENAVALRTTGEWLDIMRENDIPCSSVNALDDLMADDHLADVGLFERVEHPSEGSTIAVRSPFRSGTADRDRPAPRLGADARQILEECGVSHDRIAELKAAGVIAMPMHEGAD